MGKVKKFQYRQPLTPGGLKAMEKGTLKWFDPEMFGNFNTGTLEEYLDEKNRKESFTRSKFVWWKLTVGITIGLMFAVINQYIALKIGLVTGGAWYITYLVGLSLRWDPTEINITSTAASGADKTCTGFVFTFPSIYLLAYSNRYIGPGGTRLIEPSDITNLMPIAMVSVLMAAILGIMYFIIFRRIWLVDDPLPTPGFQALVKLTDIANDLSVGAIGQAKHSIRLVLGTTMGMMGFAFLRDFPIVDVDGHMLSPFDAAFGGPNYGHGTVRMSAEQSTYTSLGYSMEGINVAIGWFLRARGSLQVAGGSILMWCAIVPLLVYYHIPVYVPAIDTFLYPTDFPMEDPAHPGEYLLGANSPSAAAAIGVGKVMAIGAILGGGMTALVKMLPTFKSVIGDMSKSKGGDRGDWTRDRGWYEWPMDHIKLMVIVTFLFVGTIFFIGGFPPVQSYVFAALLVTVTFVLGAIAVKVSGEVGTTPVSGTSFLCLILLVGVFTALDQVFPFPNRSSIIIMALVGTTVFGSAISLSADITWEFKVGLYCGTRPMHLVRGATLGILPGAIASAMAAYFFSYHLAQGTLDLEAPQANAFAIFALILMGGKVMYSMFLLGVAIGVFVELVTGMGTAFGLGMYLPITKTLAILSGGVARDVWEKKWLEPKAVAEGWDERQKTFKLLDSFMVATGFYVGEAVMGIIVAFYLVSIT